VGRLDAGHVMRVGLGPVPFAAAAGVELEVPAGPQPLDFHTPPGDVSDARRALRRLCHGQPPLHRRPASSFTGRGAGAVPFSIASFKPAAKPLSSTRASRCETAGGMPPFNPAV